MVISVSLRIVLATHVYHDVTSSQFLGVSGPHDLCILQGTQIECVVYTQECLIVEVAARVRAMGRGRIPYQPPALSAFSGREETGWQGLSSVSAEPGPDLGSTASVQCTPGWALPTGTEICESVDIHQEPTNG